MPLPWTVTFKTASGFSAVLPIADRDVDWRLRHEGNRKLGFDSTCLVDQGTRPQAIGWRGAIMVPSTSADIAIMLCTLSRYRLERFKAGDPSLPKRQRMPFPSDSSLPIPDQDWL